MRIAITKRAIPIPGADVTNTLSLAQGFFNLGHNIELLAIEEFKEKLWKIKLGDVHKFFDIDKKIKIRYFKGNLLYYFRNFKFLRGIINFLVHYPKIHFLIDPEIIVSKYCIKQKYDLVICRDTFKTAYNNIINEIPVVLDIHGFEHIYKAKFLLKVKNNKYFKGIITLNDFLKKKFIELGFPEEKISTMDNAINLKKFNQISENKSSLRKKLNLPLVKKIILYTGSISLDRGIDVILKAANMLDREKYSFYFLGSTKKYVKIWERFIKENDIKADIRFFSVQPFKRIPSYLKSADVLLATFSPNCPSLKYMSPVKIIEYMASKTPFIATRLGRNIEICNNNECLFVNVNDPIDLSEKIEMIIYDKDLQNTLIENAYKKAKNYTFNERCKMVIDLL